MERMILNDLKKWKNKKNRKPLIIQGARQVGKTWIMKEFGRQCFEQVVYVSFDNNEQLKNIFELDYSIPRIISALKIVSGKQIRAENTLLIFDEIQEAPKALTALKYFQENAPEYAIVAAGSLLGVALHQGTSFPVGKVDFLHLYPMNFREFLLAIGEAELADLMKKQDMEMICAFHPKLSDLLRYYYYVGGMPEAVQAYVDTDDLQEVRNIQKSLLLYYKNDFSKHAPTETVPRIQMVWESIPKQLSKENRKFIYGVLRKGARAKEFELAIQWLQDCGLIHKSIRIDKPAMPLISYEDMSAFKIYMLDVGLLGARGDLDAKTILNGNEIFCEFKGSMTEQFIAQELKSYNMDLYYYSAENSRGEVDFIIQRNGHIIPIEVKAEENLQAKSLKALVTKYHLNDAIRSSMSNYKKQDWVTNVPLYLLAEYLCNNF